MNWRCWVILSSLLLSSTCFAADPAPHGSSWNFKEAGLIPVQSGGRVKPFDSYAREIVLYLTGSRTFQGWDPVDLLYSWLTYPEYWETQDFIQVSRTDVRRQLGLDEKKGRFAPHDLISNSSLGQYAQELSNKSTVTAPMGTVQKQDPREQELKRVLDRVGVIRSIISGEGWPMIPTSDAWQNVATHGDIGKDIRAQFVNQVKAYQAGDAEGFKSASLALRTSIEKDIPKFGESGQRTIEAEFLYNRMHPFMIAWILYLIAAICWIVRIDRVAGIVMGCAAAAHVIGFGLRCYVAGRPPVTNMYESVIWVSFGVVAFATIIYFVSKRQTVALAVACTLATLGLIAGDAAPAILDPGIHPLVPVLRSNYWLTIHVLTITLGYAAFALALGLADVTIYKFAASGGEAKNRSQILSLNQLTYRAMQFGVVLIAAGTILGGVWADYSWGRFWGWDPKEVWALIVLLCYLVILHGRYAGWVGQFGFAACSVVSFLSVIMAWYGVNFILGVGLHSYGFSTGGFTGVMTFVALQLGYVAFAAARRKMG